MSVTQAPSMQGDGPAPSQRRNTNLWVQLRPAIVLTLLLTVLTGLIYPGIVTGLAQLMFPYQANGSLVTVNGKVVGSDLIGQEWTLPKYFFGRPSATLNDSGTAPLPYNAENSAASNLGPTNAKLMQEVAQRVKVLQQENPGVPVPVDLVTSSGSGLDPDITIAGAYFQIPQIAKARGMSQSAVRTLINDHIQGRFLWVFGEPYVNVMDLNLALDGQK
jgi:K+-transporting ATPase ATPase C chain